MNYGFWKKLPKPFFALAPMMDVTDAAFRSIIAREGKPDVFYTEFTSTEALLHDVGREKVIHHFKYSKTEHPIVAQVFGAKTDKYVETAKLVAKLGFDGIDINMGCPEKNAVRGGSCAGLFHTPQLAKELILACKEGAPEIPVSIKIRIGDTKVDWENWIATLLEGQPAAIAIHLRTRKEMSKVPAHWEEMPNIVKFIHKQTTEATRPLIMGNGDIKDLVEAKQKIQDTGADGMMLGRAIFGNPWLFAKNLDTRPPLDVRMKVLIEHCKLYEEMFTGIKPWDIMKRHFKAYVSGFDGAADLREQLYNCKNATEVETVIQTAQLD